MCLPTGPEWPDPRSLRSRAGGGNFNLEDAEHVFQQLSVSGIALEVSHRGYALKTWVIVQTGTDKKPLASEEVQKAYLGM
jgi:hypothetical protein